MWYFLESWELVLKDGFSFIALGSAQFGQYDEMWNFSAIFGDFSNMWKIEFSESTTAQTTTTIKVGDWDSRCSYIWKYIYLYI